MKGDMEPQWTTARASKELVLLTHAVVTSHDLYAHAAAGPEYEYPACLVELSFDDAK